MPGTYPGGHPSKPRIAPAAARPESVEPPAGRAGGSELISTRTAGRVVHGAAQESNLPSVGLPRLTGFEDRLGHRARAAPRPVYKGEIERLTLRRQRFPAASVYHGSTALQRQFDDVGARHPRYLQRARPQLQLLVFTDAPSGSAPYDQSPADEKGRRMMRKLVVLSASVLLALAVVGPAAGTTPLRSSQHWEWGAVSTWLCGFDVWSDGWADVTTTTFLDATGTPIRDEVLSRAGGTYVGPTGLVARYDQAMNSSIDLATGVQSVSGATTRVVAPGGGVLLNDVGRLVFQTAPPGEMPTVLFSAGQHPTWEPGAWDPVCDYLSGGARE